MRKKFFEQAVILDDIPPSSFLLSLLFATSNTKDPLMEKFDRLVERPTSPSQLKTAYWHCSVSFCLDVLRGSCHHCRNVPRHHWKWASISSNSQLARGGKCDRLYSLYIIPKWIWGLWAISKLLFIITSVLQTHHTGLHTVLVSSISCNVCCTDVCAL